MCSSTLHAFYPLLHTSQAIVSWWCRECVCFGEMAEAGVPWLGSYQIPFTCTPLPLGHMVTSQPPDLSPRYPALVDSTTLPHYSLTRHRKVPIFARPFSMKPGRLNKQITVDNQRIRQNNSWPYDEAENKEMIELTMENKTRRTVECTL